MHGQVQIRTKQSFMQSQTTVGYMEYGTSTKTTANIRTIKHGYPLSSKYTSNKIKSILATQPHHILLGMALSHYKTFRSIQRFHTTITVPIVDVNLNIKKN